MQIYMHRNKGFLLHLQPERTSNAHMRAGSTGVTSLARRLYLIAIFRLIRLAAASQFYTYSAHLAPVEYWG